MSFLIIYTIVDVECTQFNHLDDAILMSTQNIFFMIKYVPQIFAFLSYWKNFLGTQNEFESDTGNERSGPEVVKLV